MDNFIKSDQFGEKPIKTNSTSVCKLSMTKMVIELFWYIVNILFETQILLLYKIQLKILQEHPLVLFIDEIYAWMFRK